MSDIDQLFYKLDQLMAEIKSIRRDIVDLRGDFPGLTLMDIDERIQSLEASILRSS